MLGEGKPTTGRPKKFSSRSGRSKTLCIRISPEDLELLGRLAAFYGMTKTDYLILKIRQGMAEINENFFISV